MKARTMWLTVGLALAVVLAVMAWVTATLLALDSDHTQTQRQAVLEEQARLALWRVDSAMTPILSREVALLDAPRLDTLAPPPPGVVLRFELEAGHLRALTEVEPNLLTALEGSLDAEALFAQLEWAPLDPNEAAVEAQGIQGADMPYALKTQSLRNDSEWAQRKASADENMLAYGSYRGGSTSPSTLEGAGALDGREGDRSRTLGDLGGAPGAERTTGTRPAEQTTILRALWVGEKLLLIRGAGMDTHTRIEGTWLDWPVLRELLLEDVADLLPAARLLPVEDLARAETERMLATLPALLDPGTTIAPTPTWSPLRASLVAAWVLVSAAFAAMLVLIRASLLLSERRATFVSAVTHELRTPLTTFRMYTQMLSEGMVEHKRARYLATLRREADRLSGLVENVLAYAQIESERGANKTETMSAGLLVDRIVDRLRERLESADMTLELDIETSARNVELRVDPTAVEQILFNLVDNATKYASAASEAKVCLALEVAPRKVALHVRDFGPGIEASDAKRIFEPFTKAKVDAAGTKPGVGLGLALSRRLARQMRGELSVRNSEQGADFVLSLPRA